MSQTSTLSSSQETVCSGGRNSSRSSFNKTVVIVDNRQVARDGLLSWLCEKVWCRSGSNDDARCKQTDVPWCSLLCVKHICCGHRDDIPRSHTDVGWWDMELKEPRTITSSSTACRHSRTASRIHGHRLRSGVLSKSVVHEEKNVNLCNSVASFDTSSRPKASGARCVMLADAEYGHATALDDCLVSDSEGWSWHSLSNNQPNSTEAAGHGGMASTTILDPDFDEMYDSGSGDEEVDDDAWQGILTLTVPPVYDQVKDPGMSWSLALELKKLAQYGWYWGPITRVEAEDKLTGQDDGTFLVRDSSDDHYLLSLSFRSYGRTLHTRIEHCQGAFSLYAQSGSDGYKSIVELIERSIDDSRTGVFCYSRARALGSPSFPVRLTRPVSRFAQVRSLQYLCRFLIRQYTRVDHIRQLPLPVSIKEWLEERQY